MANNKKNTVVIAKVGAPYGIDGDMRLHIFCNPPEKALDYPTWYLRKADEEAFKELKDEAVYKLGNKFLIHLESISTPEAAKSYVNAEIGVQRSQLPDASSGEYYWVDLIGLKVINEENIDLGVVTDLFETAGANDVMVVDDHGCERLIPFIDQYVKEIDFDLNHVIVHWHKDY